MLVELVLAKGAVRGVRGDCLGRFLELSTCSGVDGSGTESLSPNIVSKLSKIAYKIMCDLTACSELINALTNFKEIDGISKGRGPSHDIYTLRTVIPLNVRGTE